jgi:hypothetical protein
MAADTALEVGPALRLSTIVYGRRTVGTRVMYRVDPTGHLKDEATAETVILRRWRARSRPGTSFGGSRLSPTIWRALRTVFPHAMAACCDQKALDAARPMLRKKHQSIPSASVLVALFSFLGPERLKLLSERHTTPARSHLFGTPDLFLFAKDTETGAYSTFRFVEVKRPGERVSADQKAEIGFLMDLGLAARVVRLIERKG